MKLSEIQFVNHPILHNLHIDFTNNDGDVYTNIILVGENGVGKTTLLKEISNYNNSIYIQKLGDKSTLFIPHDIKYHEILKFITNGVTGTLNMSYGTTAPSINELLGEINSIDDDNNENITDEIFKQYVKNPTADSISINLDNIRINSAMNKDIGLNDLLSYSLAISGISNTNPEIKQKYIDNNSSGEQEIILRLKYIQFYLSQDTDIIIIDEPENSLHPRWQLKILEILQNSVFQNQKNKKEKQFFIATHSENVLKSVFNKNDTLILRLFKDNNVIKVQRISNLDRVLPMISFPEIQFLVFGIATTDYHNQLYGELQNILNKNVKDTDNYISSSNHFTAQLQKSSNFLSSNYSTLPTYIRNAIHHPDSQHNFNENELNLSITLLRAILKDLN